MKYYRKGNIQKNFRNAKQSQFNFRRHFIDINSISFVWSLFKNQWCFLLERKPWRFGSSIQLVQVFWTFEIIILSPALPVTVFLQHWFHPSIPSSSWLGDGWGYNPFGRDFPFWKGFQNQSSINSAFCKIQPGLEMILLKRHQGSQANWPRTFLSRCLVLSPTPLNLTGDWSLPSMWQWWLFDFYRCV